MGLLNRLRGNRMADNVPDELAGHLEEKICDLIESGVPEAEARSRAIRELGNPALLAEASREVWGWIWLERLLQDVRVGLRRMVRNPGFTAVAVLCMGLGAGATTAIFSVVNAVLFRSLPYAHSDRMVRVFTEFPKEITSNSPTGLRHFWLSPPEYLEVKRETQSFDAFEGWINGPANIAGSDEEILVITIGADPGGGGGGAP